MVGGGHHRERGARHYPDFGALYVAAAHALRHCKGAAAAKATLAAGEQFLEDEAIFHYILACYDSALGNLADAKEGLARAFELENGFRLKVLDEPDLAPCGIRSVNFHDPKDHLTR